MFRNVHYQEDIKYVLQQSHIILYTLGIWPLTDRPPTTINKIINIFLIVICYFILNCNMIPGVLYALFSDDKPIVKIKMIPTILYTIMGIAKYSNLLICGSEFRSCFRYIKEDWEMLFIDDARDMMMAKANISRRIFTICFTFMYCGGISYNTIMPLSKGKMLTDQNVTIRALSFPGYYVFFDPQSTPAYEIVFLLQCLCGVVMYTVTVTICGLAALFVLHACAQMQILMRLMENLVDESNSRQSEVVAKLATIIEHQIRIRNFLHLVEITLRYNSFIEIVGCTIILCLTGYGAIEEWEDGNLAALGSYVTALASVIINIFILCYFGEYVTMQAEEVNLTFCALAWYRLPMNIVQDMVLVTLASNIPLKLTAGNIIDLSLKTFGDVIKSALVYLNMFIQFAE